MRYIILSAVVASVLGYLLGSEFVNIIGLVIYSFCVGYKAPVYMPKPDPRYYSGDIKISGGNL